jgi:putative flippase GtrA
MTGVAATTSRWLKFNGVGLLGFAIQLGVLAGLARWAGLNYMIASLIAVEMAIVHNFLWHDRFTWDDRTRNSPGSLRRFCHFNLTAGAVSIAGNLLMMKWLVGVLRVNYLAANVISVLICSLLTFFVSDMVVFRKTSRLFSRPSLPKNDVSSDKVRRWLTMSNLTAPGRWGRCCSGPRSSGRSAALWFLLIVLLAATACHAAELRPETVAAFDRYVQQTEARMASEVRAGGAFLYPDSLADPQRSSAYQRLRQGEILIEKLATSKDGKSMSVPAGLVHHWVGIIFVPGASLEKTLALTQDYDNREVIYRPDVIRSKLLWRSGDKFKIFMRFYKKGFSTVVLNTEFQIQYFRVDADRVWSSSYSTHIGEVADPSHPDGPELPPDQEHGYLWRLYTYWRFEQKDGGVYVQCEAVSLTRGIPFGLNWLFGPLVKSIPRDSLNRMLGQTRAAITAPASATKLP